MTDVARIMELSATLRRYASEAMLPDYAKMMLRAAHEVEMTAKAYQGQGDDMTGHAELYRPINLTL